MKSKHSRTRARISGRYAIATALVLVLGIPSLAIAFGEGSNVRGGKRNPSENATRAYSSETEIIADNTTYGTRQSNKRDGDGGGAIYGCRSNTGNEPCLRASNLKGGRAFEYDTVGNEAGRIEVGDANSAPFSTNGKGTVTNLSADTLDGRDSADFDDARTLGGKQASDFAAAGDVLFAAVNADGTLAAGGPEAAASAKTSPAAQTYTVTFQRDVSKCSFTASVTGASADFSLGIEPGPGADQVRVDQRDVADGNTNGRAFHVQVIC